MESNLNLLKEIIMDEERLVTYISISKELCIHINDAKLLLKRFVDEIKKEQPSVTLNVQYILSGLSDTNSGRVTICPETELQNVKDKYKAVYFAHIYSVVKGSNSLDKAAFMATNKFEDFPLCTGLIKNDFCFKHTSEEIGNLKTNSQEIISNSSSKTQTLPIRQKDSQQTKPLSKTVSTDKVVKERDLEKVPEIMVKHEATSPKNKTESATKSLEKKNTNKTSKGIAGYFNKANGIENAKVKKTETTPKTKEIFKQKIETKSEKVEATPISQDNCKKEENVSNEENINSSKSKNTINRSKLNGKVDKKRKRVLHVSDSESDNEENDPFTGKMDVDNESEDEIPPTPSIDTVKITSGIVNPKKRRKIIDKTYTDEDGYILTKKEEVYESCSDKEEETAKKENIENKTQNKPENKIEVSPKTKNNKGTKKKISPPQKGKQATMTNFFKKV